MQYDVLIVGAGAAGLMAMRELTNAGYRVAILEATGTAGGRIKTHRWQQFGHEIDCGAEFIHGDAPFTMELLRQAKISSTKTSGKTIFVRDGIWFPESEQTFQDSELMEKLEQVKRDCSIQDFIDSYLPLEEYGQTRKAVQQFAEGFCLADIRNASVLALKKEWKNLQADQYRIDSGYIKLINYLRHECTNPLATFHFFAPVVHIDHKPGHVIASTASGKQYAASQVIITVSAGVLQSGDIQFHPPLQEHGNAIQQLAFGSVIKILLGFQEPVWNKEDDIGFLLTDQLIPTWWTQFPSTIPLLTGWVGGPAAIRLQKLHPGQLLLLALNSLSKTLNIETNFLRKNLNHHQVICWGLQSNVKGGYSYTSLHSGHAKEILLQPVDDTIFFAGEALHIGESQATVEAALASGKKVAEIIKGINTYSAKSSA